MKQIKRRTYFDKLVTKKIIYIKKNLAQLMEMF